MLLRAFELGSSAVGGASNPGALELSTDTAWQCQVGQADKGVGAKRYRKFSQATGLQSEKEFSQMTSFESTL